MSVLKAMNEMFPERDYASEARYDEANAVLKQTETTIREALDRISKAVSVEADTIADALNSDALREAYATASELEYDEAKPAAWTLPHPDDLRREIVDLWSELNTVSGGLL